MTNLYKSIILVFMLTLFCIVSQAQPGSGGGGGPGGGGGGGAGGGTPVPITGIELLIGAGGAYGLKKMLQKRKNN